MFKPYGPKGLLVSLGNKINESTHLKVKFLYEKLRSRAKLGINAVIPSYCELTIIFEPQVITVLALKELCDDLFSQFKEGANEYDVIKLPVCYDNEFGLDTVEVLNHIGLTKEDLIKKHTSQDYLVYMLGFVPGFLYLGGMDPLLATPRKETPRLKVDKGAVGIADGQTGIYPMDIPGGWQIIGKTPVDLLKDNLEDQIKMGDRVRFYSITKEEFENWQ